MFIEYAETLDADSLMSDEVLDELFAIEDELDRTRKYIELEDRAKSLGIKTKFERIYKARNREFNAFLRTQAAKAALTQAEESSYVTQFTKADMVQLRCGAWRASDDGVYTLGERGKVWACPHPIYPEAILVNAETGICKVKIWFKVRGIWKYAFIERKAIASNNSIIQLADYGVQVNTNNAKALVNYLTDLEALNPGEIIEHTSTSRLGWIGDTFMPYGEDIIFDNENNLKSLFESIPRENGVGNRAAWYDLVKQIRKEGRIENLIYLAASLGSVLVEPVGALPFIVDLWGETGKGKTVALMVAASVWADPNEGAYMTDAKATSTAMEIRLNVLNSLPMMLDDMAQVENQYDGDFSELIYRWCAGKGRDRSNVNLGLNRLTTWKNCILTNAEHSLVTATMKGGAVNRIIDIEMAEGYLYKDGNAVADLVRHNYGFCGHEFVSVIQNLGFDEVRRIQKQYAAKIKEYARSIGQEKEEKQIIPMSIIMTADELAEKYLFCDGVRLELEDCCRLLKNQGEVSEHKRAYEYLTDEIIRNHIKFDSVRRENYSGEEWGMFTDDGEYAVIIGTVFSQLMQRGGFQDKAFFSWAIRNDLVKPDNNGAPKRQAKIFGKNTRCVFLKMPDDTSWMDPGEMSPFDE